MIASQSNFNVLKGMTVTGEMNTFVLITFMGAPHECNSNLGDLPCLCLKIPSLPHNLVCEYIISVRSEYTCIHFSLHFITFIWVLLCICIFIYF